MARKVYSTNYSKLSITLEHAGLSVPVNFNNGRMGEGIKAKFITSDPFLQYIIEKDARFGSLFRLERVIEDEGDKKAAAQKQEEAQKQKEARKKQVDTVRDLADAIDYFASLGKTVKTKRQVAALAEELGIEFPNYKE